MLMLVNNASATSNDDSGLMALYEAHRKQLEVAKSVWDKAGVGRDPIALHNLDESIAAKLDEEWNVEMAADDAIVERLMASPARSLRDLRAKLLLLQEQEPVGDEGETCGRILSGILRDLSGLHEG